MPDGFLGGASAVADARGVVHVFGRAVIGAMTESRYDPAAHAWTFRPLGLPPAGSGTLAATPTATTLGDGRAAALATTDQGDLILFVAGSGPPVDLTARVGAPPAAKVYSSVGVVAWHGVLYAYGTDQLGGLVEYAIPAAGRPAYRPVPLPGGLATRVFQEVTALLQGSPARSPPPTAPAGSSTSRSARAGSRPPRT